MAKESGPERTSSKSIQSSSSLKIKADSGQAGKGSEGMWINESGEVCIGNECFSLRIKPDKSEVRVTIDRNKCGLDLQPVIDEIYLALGKGAPTVYETKSTVEK